MNKYLTVKEFCDIMDKASRLNLIKSFRGLDGDGGRGLHIEDLLAQYLSGLDAMSSLIESYLEFVYYEKERPSKK
jgi:hypothetical protein